jgi:hypothetical protein
MLYPKSVFLGASGGKGGYEVQQLQKQHGIEVDRNHHPQCHQAREREQQQGN